LQVRAFLAGPVAGGRLASLVARRAPWRRGV
jgi:hypothetical protein